MLTLTRREGETIIIRLAGKAIAVRLDQIKGRQARLAFEAPDEAKIIRAELLKYRM